MNILGTPARLIERHGVTVSYESIGSSTYDPATSTTTIAAGSTETPKAYKTNTSYRDSQQPNLIGRESAVYLISASDIISEPKPKDKITDGSDVFEVVSYNQIKALGQTSMYRILVVRA